MSVRRHAIGQKRWVASSTAITDRRMPVMIAPQALRKSLLPIAVLLVVGTLEDDAVVDGPLPELPEIPGSK